MKLLLVSILVLLVGVWLYQRQRRAQAAAPDEAHEGRDRRQIGQESSAYHAVSIRLGRTACRAAAELEGQRFLSASAPRLPLADCDAAECDCRFVHHADRRSGSDRRDPFASGSIATGTGNFEEERRKVRDRRSDEDDEYYF